MNLGQTLRDSAAATPGRIAVALGDQTVTYGDLDGRVDAAAWALQQVGVGPGDRVAVMMGNRVPFVVAFYATLRAGGTVVPVNTSLTAGEVGDQLSDSGAAVMIVGRAYAAVVAELRGTLPHLAHVFVTDSVPTVDPGEGMASWPQRIADAAGRHPDEPTMDEGHLAVLAYTSGTSGQPKGAMLTHGQLLANHAQLTASGAGVADGDIVLCALPLFHIYGLNVAMAMTLANGGTLELVERFDPVSTLQLIQRRAVTVIVGAPPMYVAWLNTPGSEEIDLGSVRLATSGAAPLPGKILTRCAQDLGLDIRQGYGLTEAAPVVTTSAGLPQARPGSVGRALEGVMIKIMDEDIQAEPGDPGRVLVKGANVFSGYFQKPEDTAEVLRDGWLETGDIGYLDDDELYLIDRLSDLIIVSGFNVYPVEVEAALMSHPAVMAAAVIGVPHPYTGEAVKAVVVAAPGAELTADELIGYSASRLARFKRPETVEFVSELPTLPTGKLRRRLLRDG
ncbi:MAG: AMP-binding protein [Euzebya sp.]